MIEGAPDMSTLAEAAVAMHELFTSLQDAGFAPTEALYLVGYLAANSRESEA